MDELGIWDQQMQTIIYMMDKQGPSGNYIQYPIINHNKKRWIDGTYKH